jgi:hypothetical protein
VLKNPKLQRQVSLHLSLTLQDQIDRTKLRFDKYGKQGLLCGAEVYLI